MDLRQMVIDNNEFCAEATNKPQANLTRFFSEIHLAGTVGPMTSRPSRKRIKKETAIIDKG